jgi:hypothetical protein
MYRYAIRPMKPSLLALAISTVAVVALAAAPARAHHEAIFGPHSSLMLSAPSFASLQTFSRQLGTADARTQESTLVLSIGLTPFRSVPLSFSATLPASSIDTLNGAGGSQRGLEDAIIGARYRWDLTGLQQRFGKDGNYVLAMGAVELPTGSVDHPAFSGPLDGMTALVAGIERGPLSWNGYGLYRRHGTDAAGARAGDNLFLGGGMAYTPFDDPVREKLISLQLGVSYEIYARDTEAGAAVAASGGRGLYVHPTVVWGPGGRILVFAMTSLPVVETYRDAADNNRWRVGAGVVFRWS